MIVAGIGEVLWDVLPHGMHLGGAPANFVYFANALGALGLLVSRVGTDELGEETFRHLRELGLNTDCVTQDSKHPTGKATVAVDDHGVPRFTIHQPAAWDFIETGGGILDLLKTASAVCFGTLGRRHPIARASIRTLVSSVPPAALRVFDVNLREPFFNKELVDEGFGLANVVKLNDDELGILSEMYGLKGSEMDCLRELAYRFELNVCALTKGEAGSVVWTSERVSHQPAVVTEITDTVGAGDSFTAALVIGLLRGEDLDVLHARAARLAGYVCSQSGATPSVPSEFKRELM